MQTKHYARIWKTHHVFLTNLQFSRMHEFLAFPTKDSRMHLDWSSRRVLIRLFNLSQDLEADPVTVTYFDFTSANSTNPSSSTLSSTHEHTKSKFRVCWFAPFLCKVISSRMDRAHVKLAVKSLIQSLPSAKILPSTQILLIVAYP